MKKELIKSKMSHAERTQRRVAVGKAASDKIAKSEQLNFRIEEHTIKELQELSFQKGTPVGTMIRGWVLERLLQEKMGKQETSAKALRTLNEIYTKLNSLFSSTPQIRRSK